MPIIFGLYEDQGGGEIIGLSANGGTIDRLIGESDLSAFALRAAVALGRARILVACYARRHEPEPSPAPFLSLAAATKG